MVFNGRHLHCLGTLLRSLCGASGLGGPTLLRGNTAVLPETEDAFYCLHVVLGNHEMKALEGIVFHVPSRIRLGMETDGD